jgi:DNA-binding transcriptional MocR family regulator
VRLDTDPYLSRYADRVTGLAASEIRALFAVAERPEIVSFAGGMPDLSVMDLDAVADLTAHIIREQGAVALQYGGGQGRQQLREALVDVMAHAGAPATPDELLVTVGGQQALELIAKCFIDPGDVVIAEGPTYVGAVAAMNSHQADVRHVPMDGDGMRMDLLEDLLAQLAREGRRAKYVYTIPNHQNPGGVSMSEERRRRLAEIAIEHDLLILEDDAYGLLGFDGETGTSLRTLVPDRVIYLGTMSKTFAPGVRSGWIAAPTPVREKLVLLREAADLCPSNLTQLLIERWLATQPWQEQVKRYRALYQHKAELMLGALEAEMPAEVDWTRPRGGFFVWLTVPTGIDTSALLAKAIGRRVAYVPGRGFYDDGSGGDQLRLCFSFPPADRIREGVSRLAELLHDELGLLRAVYGEGAPELAGRRGEAGRS